MPKVLDHHYTKFLPSEAERITGVVVAKQRDWRRHGHIPGAPRSWNEFVLPQLAALYAMNSLAMMGFGPTKSKDAAEVAAVSIVFRSLQIPGAYDPKSEFGPLGMSAAARKLANENNPFGRVIPGGRFFIVWPDGEWYSADDVSAALALDANADRVGQPVAVLDIQKIAADILAKAQRPVVFVFQRSTRD